jgi:DMSO/TMAO reductase YedYZ molybdopterin-dependent catalytic subunit
MPAKKGGFPMCRFAGCVIVLSALLFSACLAVAEEPLTVAVRGDVLKPGKWTVEDLKKQFAKEIQTVKFSQGKDAPEQTGTGIPLFSLIQAAAPKVEKEAKHYDLTFIVYVEARDSYRIFFSLAELIPEVGNTPVWLFWEVNGKGLSEKESPCRLIVTGDKGHSRSIFGIASINLVDGTRLANQLSSK